jgi:hypothetical protein
MWSCIASVTNEYTILARESQGKILLGRQKELGGQIIQEWRMCSRHEDEDMEWFRTGSNNIWTFLTMVMKLQIPAGNDRLFKEDYIAESAGDGCVKQEEVFCNA